LQNHEIEKIRKTKSTGDNEKQAVQIREATNASKGFRIPLIFWWNFEYLRSSFFWIARVLLLERILNPLQINISPSNTLSKQSMNISNIYHNHNII